MRKILPASSSGRKDNVSSAVIVGPWCSIWLSIASSLAGRNTYWGLKPKSVVILSANNFRFRAKYFDHRLRCISILKIEFFEVVGGCEFGERRN